MRRPKTLFLMLIPFLLVTVAVVFGSSHNFKGQTKSVFPPGNWNFSAHPFMGEGYKTRPVVVTSVGSEVTALSVNVVGVRNISSKPVAGIKFGWFLSYDKDRTKVLRKGETPLVAIQPVLEAGSVRGLKPTIFSFLEIHKSLIKKGRLDGNYRLEVAVTELLFSDRSTWRVGQEVSGLGLTTLQSH